MRLLCLAEVVNQKNSTQGTGVSAPLLYFYSLFLKMYGHCRKEVCQQWKIIFNAFLGDMFGGDSPTEDVGVGGIHDNFAAELAQKLGVAAAEGVSEQRAEGTSSYITLHEKYACYSTLEVCLLLSCGCGNMHPYSHCTSFFILNFMSSH